MRENTKESKKEKICSLMLAAFGFPIALMLIIYALRGIYPFGSTSILVIDLNNQYISFFGYLKEILAGEHGFVYTFSKTLGGDMIGLSAYYLLSPLNLLTALFPLEKMDIAIEVITLLKIGLCGLTFYLLVSDGKKSWKGIIFSTAYALTSYNIMYQQNIMWLDGVVLLPLMCLGIRKIIKEKTPFLYMWSLFLAIVTNYYIGFMLCIFSVLFFLFSFFFEGGKSRKFKVILHYGLASGLAGGLAMWLLIPVLRSLEGGKASFDLSILTMNANFHWSDFLVKLFIGSSSRQQIVSGLPNVYCTMIALVFLGMFFLNRKIRFSEKIGGAVLLVILFLSFYLNGINLSWHGFNIPTWFPYRYSFVFSFVVLFLAWEGMKALEYLNLKEILICMILTAGVITFAAVWMMRKSFDFMTKEQYLLSLLAVGLTVIWSLWENNIKKAKAVISGGKMSGLSRKLSAALLVLVCGVELCANGIYSIDDLGYKERNVYEEFVESVEPAVSFVKEYNDGFYRMEKTFNRKECDPMTFGYNGLSHYSSTEKIEVKTFMGQMGFRNNGNWSYYNRGSSYAADGLLGVKYILSKDELPSFYTKIYQEGEISVYENPFALSIGFMADETVFSVDLTQANKFELQNDLYRSLCNEVDGELFRQETVENIILYNLLQENREDGYFYKEDAEEDAYIEYTFKASGDNPILGYLGTNDMQKVNIYVNGESIGKYFDVYQYDIMRLGSFKEGEEVTVRVELQKEYVNITDVWFYYQDMDVYQNYYETISEGAVEFTSVTDTDLEGIVTNKSGKEYVYFTIPYEASWKATIDGEEAILEKAGIFMAVQVPEGTHEIKLHYKVNGLNTGRVLTGASALVFLIWFYLRRRCRKLLKVRRNV